MTGRRVPFVETLREQVVRTATQEAVLSDSAAPAPRLIPPRRPRRLWLTAGGLALVAALAVALVLVTSGATPPPAYALTRNADGSLTVTIRNISSAIPALNARFTEMGINETVIPVRAGCKATQYFGYPDAAPDQSLTFRPGDQHLRPGWDGVIAVERLADGHMAMSIGARKTPLPACVHAVVLNLNALRHAAKARNRAR